jgi:hypothetical protein
MCIASGTSAVAGSTTSSILSASAGRSAPLSAAFAPTRQHTELFAVGEDGYLHYMGVPNGNWVHDATSFRAAGKVAGAVSAVFSPFANHTEVYLRGSDGNLHFYFARNAAWCHHCAELGADRVTGDICAIYVPTRNHSEVFFQGGDGLLHHCRFTADGWRHDGSSFRAAGRVRGRIAALFDEARRRVEVYCTGEDGGLHRFVEESGAWKHELRPAPRPTLDAWRTPIPVAGSPAVAARVRPYAMRWNTSTPTGASPAALGGAGIGWTARAMDPTIAACRRCAFLATRSSRSWRGAWFASSADCRRAWSPGSPTTPIRPGPTRTSAPWTHRRRLRPSIIGRRLCCPRAARPGEPGSGVRYAVEFEYPDGTVGRSGWWSEGVYYESTFALPHMNIPRDPTDQIVARRVIREFRDLPERVIARIANNTDSALLDTDLGVADMPPPPASERHFLVGDPAGREQPGVATRSRGPLRGGIRVPRRDGGARRLGQQHGAGRRGLRVRRIRLAHAEHSLRPRPTRWRRGG